jgi:hypothetical protein
MNGDQLAHWLEQDDAESRPHRAQRAKQVLDSITFPESGFLFFGGMETSQSFTEARLAYVNGLYLATVLLALVVAEQKLAGTLYAAGVEKAKKLKLEDLLSVSLEERLITQGEHELLNKLRGIRNAYSHYRPLSHPSKLARRSISTGAAMEDVLKEDALTMIDRRRLQGAPNGAHEPNGNLG